MPAADEESDGYGDDEAGLSGEEQAAADVGTEEVKPEENEKPSAVEPAASAAEPSEEAKPAAEVSGEGNTHSGLCLKWKHKKSHAPPPPPDKKSKKEEEKKEDGN